MQRFLFSLVVILATCGLMSVGTINAASVDDALREFNQAMSSDDATAKKKAMQALAKHSGDKKVQKALAKVVEDRNVGRLAIKTLGGATGNTKATTAKEWQDWLASEKKAEEDAEEKKSLEKKLKELEQTAGTAGEAGSGSDAAQTAGSTGPDRYMDDKTEIELGKLDRVFFNDGSILSCYIILKRVDLDGNLTSIKIMHKNRMGEETLEAHLISHIDEDYQQ